MAETPNSSKKELLDILGEVINTRGSGLISVVTNTKHSVMFRFSEGKLIGVHSRHRKLSAVINELNECGSLRFNFTTNAIEDKPEIVPGDKFLRLIAAGIGNEVEDDTSPIVSASDNNIQTMPSSNLSEPVRAYLAKIASEYVGPVADMLVEEAFEDSDDIAQAIDFIAQMIPDPKQASAFRAEAGNISDLTAL